MSARSSEKGICNHFGRDSLDRKGEGGEGNGKIDTEPEANRMRPILTRKAVSQNVMNVAGLSLVPVRFP